MQLLIKLTLYIPIYRNNKVAFKAILQIHAFLCKKKIVSTPSEQLLGIRFLKNSSVCHLLQFTNEAY